MPSSSRLTAIFTILLLIAKVLAYISTPLWLDALKQQSNDSGQCNWTVVTDNPAYVLPQDLSEAEDIVRQTDPYVAVFLQALVPSVVFGLALVVVRFCFPGELTGFEASYPQVDLLLTGLSQCISALLVNYASKPDRTAPYLAAIMTNFFIPIQVIVRLILLRKWPTWRKALCALVVIMAEFICLLPKIFPQLEKSDSGKVDGGATGISGFLWPLVFVLGHVPTSITNVLMERSVKEYDGEPITVQGYIRDTRQLNMIFYLFFFHFYYLLITVCAFWTDFVPWLGTVPSIYIFAKRMVFNVGCLFGQNGCSARVYLLGWTTSLSNLLGNTCIAYLLRYSEGATYMVVAKCLRSPILLLFWTLFQIQPFEWYPQAHLGTWLGIAGLCVMVPATVFYTTGPPDRDVRRPVVPVRTHPDETSPLLAGDQLS